MDEVLAYLESADIDADIVALPPDVDELTDEEDIEDENLENPTVADVPGSSEINAPEEKEEEEDCLQEVFPDIRYDGKNHILEKRSNQRHCQLDGCKGRPRTYCSKCNVTLCIACFKIFHNV